MDGLRLGDGGRSISFPILAILWMAAFPTENIWGHLIDTVLPRYVANTFILMVGVGLGVTLIGTSTAWLVEMCRFPGRRIFVWALLLPLAMPAFVIAYVYTDLLEFAGPVQGALRDLFGWQTKLDYWFPEIRSMGGAIAMLTLVLYPYVYAMARAAFLEQSVCVLEAGRTLGRGPWRCFWEIAVPLARPGIVVGVTLALMETLNDFGTIDYFAVQTLTAGVFDVWFTMGNPGGAAQIAMVMLVFVIGLLWIERASRRRQRFHHTTGRLRDLPGYDLRGWRRWMAIGVLRPSSALSCRPPSGPICVGEIEAILSDDFLLLAQHSLTLSAVSAVVALLFAHCSATRGGYRRRCPTGCARLAGLGYAVPGSVLAIGIIVPLAAFDNAVDAFAREWVGISTGLLLSGTPVALVLAYLVRFSAVSQGAVESGLARITQSMDQAARTLGHGPMATLRRVHLPLMRGSALTAMVLVFVDTMKELPATLVLRPFDFETLATHVYRSPRTNFWRRVRRRPC